MAEFPEPQFIKAGDISLAIYEADGDPARQRPHDVPERQHVRRPRVEGPVRQAS